MGTSWRLRWVGGDELAAEVAVAMSEEPGSDEGDDGAQDQEFVADD